MCFWLGTPSLHCCLPNLATLALLSTGILLCELRQAQSAAPLFHPLTSSLEKPDAPSPPSAGCRKPCLCPVGAGGVKLADYPPALVLLLNHWFSDVQGSGSLPLPLWEKGLLRGSGSWLKHFPSIICFCGQPRQKFHPSRCHQTAHDSPRPLERFGLRTSLVSLSFTFFLSFLGHSPPHAHRQAAVFLEKMALLPSTSRVGLSTPKLHTLGTWCSLYRGSISSHCPLPVLQGQPNSSHPPPFSP